jgi:hypothetical protein
VTSTSGSVPRKIQERLKILRENQGLDSPPGGRCMLVDGGPHGKIRFQENAQTAV